MTTPKKTTYRKRNSFTSKLRYGYLYFKKYALWFFLALFVLLIVNIVIKNMGRDNSPKLNQSNNASMINTLVVDTKIAPVKETQSTSSAQLESLKKQLLIEKEKNKNLEKTLNNQELQISSALDEINQNFKRFESHSKGSNKISVLKDTTNDQTAYYNKVKAALGKISQVNNKKEKLSTTADDNSQVGVSKKEG